MPLLFNPASYDPSSFDETTRAKLLSLVDFFETKGLARNKEEYYSGEWYTDFLDLIAREKIFATFATRFWASIRCHTGTPGRCRCSAWGRCG